MRKLFGFLLAAVLLSSCSLVKDANFNKDNSGSMAVYINMKEFVDKMGKGEMDDKTREKLGIFSEPNPSLDSLTMIEFIEKTDGVTEVTEIKDETNFHFGMNFKFDGIPSLNSALNRMKYFQTVKSDSLRDATQIGSYSYYEADKKSVTLKEPVKSSSGGSSNDKMAKKMGKMLSMKYACSFEGRGVKSVDSKFTVNKEGKNKVIIDVPADKMDGRTDEVIAKISLK